jgi:hypothetical protein
LQALERAISGVPCGQPAPIENLEFVKNANVVGNDQVDDPWLDEALAQ